ncbi:MAG TPA: universal stress protein [Chitinophagaceae bacterium]|nr:universal stress protein [Chitinophagaceae bacterium]
MIRLIVPTDFSETSRNALAYAFDMAQYIPLSSVTIFNSFDKIAAGSDGTPLFSDPDTRRNISLIALENLKNSILDNRNIDVRLVAEEGSLVNNLEKLVKDDQVDMIVMGINGATRMEQIMIGSSTLSVIAKLNCPVLIVPPSARYNRIRTVVYASDMKNVAETTPVKTLRRILSLFIPKLFVVNVDVDHFVEISEEYKKEKAVMTDLLEGFEPDYAFIRLYDFAEAIHQFAIDRKADLIITAPKKHGFLEKIFTTSHTEKLAYHTHIPLLAVQE